jgi:hypothetical protein
VIDENLEVKHYEAPGVSEALAVDSVQTEIKTKTGQSSPGLIADLLKTFGGEVIT